MRTRRVAAGIGLMLAALLMMAHSNAALATNGNKCPKLGYCPPGTCAQDGSTRACNTKNCSAHNCRH